MYVGKEGSYSICNAIMFAENLKYYGNEIEI
jgi:hypothetical protein